MTTHAAENATDYAAANAAGQPAPTWDQLQDRAIQNLHESAAQAEQSRLMAQAYLRTVLQNEDLTQDARTSLDEAHAILNLQAQALSLVKNFIDLLPNPVAQAQNGG